MDHGKADGATQEWEEAPGLGLGRKGPLGGLRTVLQAKQEIFWFSFAGPRKDHRCDPLTSPRVAVLGLLGLEAQVPCGCGHCCVGVGQASPCCVGDPILLGRRWGVGSGPWTMMFAMVHRGLVLGPKSLSLVPCGESSLCQHPWSSCTCA